MTNWKKILFLTLAVKMLLFLIVISAFFHFPFGQSMREANFLDPDYQKFSVFSSFMAWDSQHYLFLSDHGYRAYQESNRFYPLFPGIIHLASLPFHNSFLGGIIISNIISLFAILLFYFFVQKYFSEKIAFLSVIFLLAFPTSFYLSFIYSEGIFLFLALCFFWFLYKKEFFVAGLFSLFLPLTRPVGIFIVVPFAVYLLEYVWEKTKNKKYSKKELLKLLHILWPFAGFGLLLLFYTAKTGYPFEPFLLDKTVAGQWSVWNIFNPLIFLKNLFSFPLAIHGFTNSALDRIFFVGYLISLPLVYKKTTKSLFSYFLLMGGVAFFGSFMSYTRYLFLAFPLFISLAALLSNKKYSIFLYPFLFLSIVLQIIFVILQGLNYWVS